jgi:asparagine synthase (glutamine-hydrolysing)
LHRYIAFVWNTQASEKNSVAKNLVRRLKSLLPNWRCALDVAGLLVYHVGAAPPASHVYQLGREGGVVLGKVFSRERVADCGPGEFTFAKREIERLQRSEGRHLVDEYWGRYVAMIKEDRGPRVWILRDPTGAVPCFISEFRGISVICSHVDDCAMLGLVRSSINWDHVAAYLWFDHLVTEDTGLENVRQVQAGECVEIRSDGTNASYYWRPDRIHDRRTVENREHAKEELSCVIQDCVGAWASCYGSILHELSGGLDSAIVLGCLSRMPGSRNILCENYFTKDAEGDERVFARQAARLAEVELIETAIPSSDRSIESMFESTRCATPAHLVFVPETQSVREQVVKEHQIEAVFSGRGGDHFFQRYKTPHICGGIRLASWSACRDCCRHF